MTAAILVVMGSLGAAVVVAQSLHAAKAAADQLTSGELAQNGSFESGAAPWQVGGNSNFVVYANGQIGANDMAYAGAHYAATNASSPGGGFYEDINGVTIEPGDTYCGSAELRDQLNETGASGSFVIWLIGGSSNENGTANFSNLGHGANWEQYSTCVTATTAHSQLRIQFYPAVGSPTVDVDAVDVHDSLQVAAPVAQNGGFESGSTPWQSSSGSNFVVYANGQIGANDKAFAGTHYAASNASSPGGGFYEDITGLTINSGDSFCGSAELRDQLSETGAAGSFAIWLMGGSSNESGSVNYSHLGNGANWKQFSTCATATTAHTQVRIQFYPTPGTPTVDVDAVTVQDDLDIQESVSQNGSFESGMAPWQEGGHSNFAVYANGQIGASDAAYAGAHYAATNASGPGGGFYEDINGITVEPGDTFCGSAEIREQLNETGGSGTFVIWLMGGTSNENGITTFSNLGNGANWKQFSTCATATTAHSQVRIQFYPTVGGGTVDVDAVETGNVSGGAPNADCTPDNSCTPQTFAGTLLSQPGINAPITASNEYALEKWTLA
jgi:hypothetical protein